LRIPEVRARMIRLGYEPKGTTAQEHATIMAADAARWTPVIKDVGFRGE
jgi:tripartite-type tricarboxylate transporter receptor subunit TctC